MAAQGSVLVVDDDQIILDSLSEFLRLEGYDVEAAAKFEDKFNDVFSVADVGTYKPNPAVYEMAQAKLGKDEEIIEVWEGFRAAPQWLELPTAPTQPIIYDRADTSPQPRLHRDAGAGMAVTIGRLRTCPLLGFKFVVLSHNTIRGAAGGSLLAAELAVAQRVVPSIEWPTSAKA